MSDTIQCELHGEREQGFICSHLLGDSTGQGFNRNEPTEEAPYPDAWCDNCEIIRSAHDGWNEESEKLVNIVMVCSSCYEASCIRNTRTDVTLDDLAGLRWKCSVCEEWHTGPCLDLGSTSPYYWTDEHEKASERHSLLPFFRRKTKKTFLDKDFCAIDGQDFFIRGNIHLPILGSNETFSWGVWGSLSRENFEKLLAMHDDPKRADLPPMFSWLSNQLDEYPDTLNLKMYAHIQPPHNRPHFELERTDHPLAVEYYRGISPERIKEIMARTLRELT